MKVATSTGSSIALIQLATIAKYVCVCKCMCVCACARVCVYVQYMCMCMQYISTQMS